MEDEVKFIFKTLIKVPCIIFVAYLILNLLLFSYTYFKLLGMSYVVMQTCVENNYIPNSEFTDLLNYVDDLNTNTNGVSSYTDGNITTNYNADSEVVSCAGLIIGNGTHNNHSADIVVFYSAPLCADGAQHDLTYAFVDNTVGVNIISDINSISFTSALTRKQYGNSKYVGVYARYKMVWPLTYNQTYTLDSNDYINANSTILTESEINKARKSNVGTLNIRITYTVPGLKYYPDLSYS
jgi:hypothetical protein